ncbi:hypothetical protein L0Y59_05125 [Candidatus Uhrbacteria bacterium]|nr:hypothetical protein [Candidatus Uhrbacteria bacterium]
MKSNPLLRLEWISLVYLTLFVFAILSPRVVRDGLFGVSEETVEEILIFIFGITGLVTFSLYQRLMERRELERAEVESERERIKRELVESYRYIGSVNRQVNVLKELVNQTSVEIVEKDLLKKDILTSLLANAAASVGAHTAFIRYVDLGKGRTDHEVLHSHEGIEQMKVSNKDLLRIHDSGAAHAYINSECGKELLVVPSDHQDVDVKAFLLTLSDPPNGTDQDTSLLKVFVNQAELIYHTLRRQNGSRNGIEPLELVDEAKNRSLGDIS